MAGRIPVYRRVGDVLRMRGKPGTELQHHDNAAALSDPPPQTGHYLTADLHQ